MGRRSAGGPNASQRREELEFKNRRRFYTDLREANSREDVFKLLTFDPGIGSPVRQLYSNLHYFIAGHQNPAGATPEERTAYAGFIERLRQNGKITDERADAVLAELKPR